MPIIKNKRVAISPKAPNKVNIIEWQRFYPGVRYTPSSTNKYISIKIKGIIFIAINTLKKLSHFFYAGRTVEDFFKKK